jgi:hypothetical protein
MLLASQRAYGMFEDFLDYPLGFGTSPLRQSGRAVEGTGEEGDCSIRGESEGTGEEVGISLDILVVLVSFRVSRTTSLSEIPCRPISSETGRLASFRSLTWSNDSCLAPEIAAHCLHTARPGKQE